MALGSLFRRAVVPRELAAALDRDERVLAVATSVDGSVLAASRFGLWVVDGGPGGDGGGADRPSGGGGGVVADGAGSGASRAVERVGWHLVSKARLTARVLSLVVADEAGLLDGVVPAVSVLVDRPAREFSLGDRSGLTDVVHARVRRSVVASRHLPWPRAGGWVVLRRVPGRDGVARQVRLDPGADAAAPGFADAVTAVARDLEESSGVAF